MTANRIIILSLVLVISTLIVASFFGLNPVASFNYHTAPSTVPETSNLQLMGSYKDSYDGHREAEAANVEEAIANSDLPSKTFSYTSPYCRSPSCRQTSAHVLSGWMRHWYGTYPSQQAYIMSPLSPDVFIYAGCPGRIKTKHEGETLLRLIFGLYHPRSLVVQAPGENRGLVYPDEMQDEKWPKLYSKSSPYAMFSMFNRIEAANNLKKEWERTHNFTYQIVIRNRFDNAMYQPFRIPDPVLPHVVYTTGLNLPVPPLTSPQNVDDMLEGASVPWSSFDIIVAGSYVGDNIVFGSSEAMDKYCSAYSKFDTIYHQVDEFAKKVNDKCIEEGKKSPVGDLHDLHFPEGYMHVYLHNIGLKVVILPNFIWEYCWQGICQRKMDDVVHFDMPEYCNMPCGEDLEHQHGDLGDVHNCASKCHFCSIINFGSNASSFFETVVCC